MNLFMAIWVSIIFSLVDYFGYHTIGQATKLELTIFKKTFTINLSVKLFGFTLTSYRTLQIILGACLLWILWNGPGFWAIVMALLLYFTFIDDLLFYLFCETFHKFKDDVGVFKREVLDDQVTWANWTIYGWFRKDKKAPVPGYILLFQAAIGLALCIAIQMAG